MDTRTGTTAGHMQRGLLIEADLTILSGTELFFDACRKPLAGAGVKIDRDLFLRYIFGHPLSRGVAALLERQNKGAASASAVAGEIVTKYTAALRAAADKSRDGITTFAKDAAGRGVKVGLVTQLPEEVAKTVYAGALVEGVDLILETPACACVHGWENWRRAAHKLQIRERLCVAIAAPASAHGALAASMRVIAMADPWQDHVDCGGVDLLTDAFQAPARAAALTLLKLA